MSESNHNRSLAERVAKEYRERFGTNPALILRSPGRINLIGEHTDYNDGFVMPSAVSQGIYMAIGPNEDCLHRWFAMDLDEEIHIGTDGLGSLREDWSDFIQGAWLALREIDAKLDYFNMAFGADLPMGSGMSSSSALTCGALFGLNSLANLGLDGSGIANTAYKVERGFVGVRGGIMDQYASVLSEPGNYLLLDCRDRSYRQVKMPEGLQLFLIHSMVQRELKTSGYNDRSDECSRALEQVKQHRSVDSFRDLTADEFSAMKDLIDPIPFKRIQYVFKENHRVMQVIDALQQGDGELVGKLMYEGHAGLRDEFEVSIEELDFLVDSTRDEDWILGARMMGGGFGGCTINLATRNPDDEFKAKVTAEYRDRFGIEPMFIPVSLTGGTSILNLD